MEGAHLAIITTNDNSAFVTHIKGQIIPNIRHITNMPRNLPMLVKQLSAFEIEQATIMVSPCGQSATIPIIAGFFRVLMFDFHVIHLSFYGSIVEIYTHQILAA